MASNITRVRTDYSNKMFEELTNNARVIPLYNEINEESAFYVNTRIRCFNLKDNKSPIILEINSPGGSCTDGLSIVDAITSSSAPVITIVSGSACSMASIISIVGNKRFITPNSFWMGHPIASYNNDYLPYIKDQMLFLNKLDDIITSIYKERTKLTPAELNKIKNGELWLTAEQCKEKGVVDSILKKDSQIKRRL